MKAQRAFWLLGCHDDCVVYYLKVLVNYVPVSRDTRTPGIMGDFLRFIFEQNFWSSAACAAARRSYRTGAKSILALPKKSSRQFSARSKISKIFQNGPKYFQNVSQKSQKIISKDNLKKNLPFGDNLNARF